MPTDDDQNHEIAAFFEHTPAGFKAGVKSRAASAVDFMLGRFVSRKGRRNQRLEDAVTEQDVRLIQRLGEMRLEQLEKDPEFVEAAMEQHFSTAIRHQENKVEVVKLALEDLREQQSPEGLQVEDDTLDSLSDDFLGRFERYAEDASSKEVRERWARVLASEIKRPGSFSAKVLRLIDETESSTARLFEDLCRHRIGNGIAKCTAPSVDYLDVKRLVSAGLIVEQGDGGQVAQSSRITDPGGGEIDVIRIGNFAIAIPAGATIPRYNKNQKQALIQANTGPGIPIMVLTDEGHAISSIIDADEATAWEALISAAVEELPSVEISDYRLNAEGAIALVRKINSTS